MASTDPEPGRFDLLKDTYVGVVFLTRLPTPPWPEAARRPLARAMWSAPLAGAIVGIVGGVVYAICDALGWPVYLAALIGIAAMVATTGGLHEDGLSDLADGAWSGGTVQRRLEIMSDSRIGAFGAIALVISVAGRAAAAAELDKPEYVLGGLIAAAALSRATMPILMALGRPAKSSGLGASAGTPEFGTWTGGLLLAILIAVMAAPTGWLPGLLGAVAGAALVGWLAVRRLGGYTGDTLGAAQQVAELFALAFIAAATVEGG